MLTALFACLPFFVLLQWDGRVIEKYIVQLDLCLLLTLLPGQAPIVKVGLAPFLPQGKRTIPGCPFQQDEMEVSIHCNLHGLTPISAPVTGASWEMPFSSSPQTPSHLKKPSPSFYDDNHHQRHHLSLMPENDSACPWLTMLRTIISLEGYSFTHQGKCHFCKVINVVYRESGYIQVCHLIWSQFIPSNSWRLSHSRSVSCKSFLECFLNHYVAKWHPLFVWGIF